MDVARSMGREHEAEIRPGPRSLVRYESGLALRPPSSAAQSESVSKVFKREPASARYQVVLKVMSIWNIINNEGV